jgi:hypothetical protein
MRAGAGCIMMGGGGAVIGSSSLNKLIANYVEITGKWFNLKDSFRFFLPLCKYCVRILDGFSTARRREPRARRGSPPGPQVPPNPALVAKAAGERLGPAVAPY